VELRTEIEILAPVEHVWRVLTDFGAYHEWNPFITSISGEPAVGAALTVTLSPPESDERTQRTKVTVYEARRELRWTGKLWLPGLFDGEHFFRCVEAEPERTRFVQGEDFKGLLLKFSGERLKQLARGFVYMNQALKRRSEQRRAHGRSNGA
jgi:hypothetical protein